MKVDRPNIPVPSHSTSFKENADSHSPLFRQSNELNNDQIDLLKMCSSTNKNNHSVRSESFEDHTTHIFQALIMYKSLNLLLISVKVKIFSNLNPMQVLSFKTSGKRWSVEHQVYFVNLNTQKTTFDFALNGTTSIYFVIGQSHPNLS